MTLFAQLRRLVRGDRRLGLSAVFFSVVAGAQIALPLAPSAAAELVTLTVFSLALATFFIATTTWGHKRLLAVGASVVVAAYFIELVGSRFGVPFGSYDYEDALFPQFAGVPLLVPVAWFAMGLPAYELGRRASSSALFQAFVGGFALTAWDFFLDPMMTGYGFWTWEDTSGGWQGIPWTNYFGWFLVGSAICWLIGRTLPAASRNDGLAFFYLWMIGFSALGFLLPFAFDRPIVGIGGLAVSLPAIYVSLKPKERTWLAQS